MAVDFTRPLLFRETADQVIHRIKTVTRRVARIRAGVVCGASPWRVGALSKCYKRSPRAGGKPFAIALIEDSRLERLGQMRGVSECALEGFPDTNPEQFIAMFALINDLKANAHDDLLKLYVWRVQFTLDVPTERLG
jgi:hypothetical protein